MSSTAMVWWCTSSLLFAVISVLLIPHTQGSHFLPSEDIPVTSFSCTGRHTGYYADMETGCQVYHMCGVGGRQFSYSCPNTTLFHQRMLICAHWYQVNCSRSEFHYDANLLIGQRDKPFVRDDEPKFFNYRKRLPSHGIQRTTEGGLAGDRGDGSTTSKSKPMTVDIRQFYNEWNPLVPTSTTVDTNTRPQHSVELGIQNNVLLPRFNLSDATVVYDRPASARSTTADYTKVNGNVPSQNSSATTDIRDGSAFINRFVLHEGVHNNSHTANGYKNISGKDVDMYDFKIKDSSSKIPSLYLQPPHYNNEEENNKIELVFEDPRRVFYIADNGSDSVNSEPVLVTIRLNKSQMLFRNRHFCDKCHPLFIINKNTCTPCVVVR